jgi:hypothetical protein
VNIDWGTRPARSDLLVYAVGIFLIILVSSISFIALLEITDPFDDYLAHGPSDNNRLINLLEIFYFIANLLLCIVAIFALTFARRQAIEAENTRKASIYLQISALWSSHRTMSSRMYVIGLSDKFGDPSYMDPIKKEASSAPDYIKRVLLAEQRRSRISHRQKVFIITFLEDLGLLCEKGYVHELDVFEFISTPIVFQVDLLIDYIREFSHDGVTYSRTLSLHGRAQKFLAAKESASAATQWRP